MNFLDSLRTVTTSIKNYIDNKFNKLGDLASLDEVTMDDLAEDVKESLNKTGGSNKDLTFTGAVTGTYNGSAAKTVNIVGKAGTGTGAEIFNYTGNNASGKYSHAEGVTTRAIGEGSHAEGGGSMNPFQATIEANSNTIIVNDLNGFLVGGIIRYQDNCAKITSINTNDNSITLDKILSSETKVNASLYRPIGIAYGNYSHAEGRYAVASGGSSHAEGFLTTASKDYSHAEGTYTTASGISSHAEGYYTTASGDSSHAEGYYTTASGTNQHAQGKYNISNSNLAHIVGNGNSDTGRSNAHTLDWSGNGWFAGAVTTNGADYAELFEWADGNPDNKDRRGRFVTLDGEKIRFATDTDDYILGIVSAAPAVLGDRDDCWQGRWVTDVFGERLTKEYVTVDEETGEEHVNTWWIEAPEYDSSVEYIPREERKEWAKIGMVGKLVVVDDGTCVVNGYCKPNADGIGTTSDSGYRVMARIDENHIRVLVK